MAVTEFTNSRSRHRDQQDYVERHVWGNQTHSDQGSTVRVRGTDTIDEDAPVMNGGASFNLEDNSNSEVLLLSLGSDTNQKVAMLTIPRDKQRPWAPGHGGIQHPTNPDMAVDISDDGIRLISGEFFLGPEGTVRMTVDGNTITFTGSLHITGDLDIDGYIKNKGVNIGHDHRHSGVRTGAGSTGGPF